ncbi:pentapeptide repeat-containing protein [Paenibacillus harenae]|uniref:Uncharacterized protein YjbI with pentapeptide repeats n=1 Tax=Paenibacillus harenae TaxID=306543 RepID=A0ABT9U203_PAEHA|nr:pentapeptide repeat-containing protein [Paenibacillus harenae]MDQ0059961.1 uncharacterized protein YjbI with pentapeptide repeats [Paenibacillus harenae]MDQ0112484.1 uncharacterized protein YjbI with pentapeptide repeats [Paenibacillus harenae]
MSGTKVKVEAPKLPAAMESRVIDAYELSDEYAISDCVIRDSEVDNQTGYRVCFDRISFQNVVFRGTSLPKSEWTDVRFDNCDLSNIDLNGAIFHRVTFHECKLLGMDLTEATLRNVLFDECYADYAVLRFSNTKQVKLVKSSFGKADLSNMTLAQTSLQECNIDGAQFAQTKLRGMDLSSCDFASLSVNIEDLQGCIISPLQSSSFATMFGLVVNED